MEGMEGCAEFSVGGLEWSRWANWGPAGESEADGNLRVIFFIERDCLLDGAACLPERV